MGVGRCLSSVQNENTDLKQAACALLCWGLSMCIRENTLLSTPHPPTHMQSAPPPCGNLDKILISGVFMEPTTHAAALLGNLGQTLFLTPYFSY